jgi:uncharacterized protein (TIGR02453 family)
MPTQPHFTPALFDFLTELEAHNTRDWFHANTSRYREVVQEPMLRFISDFSGPLARISRHFVADPRPVGGSMFRIHRDVRFSRDKRPYKTHAGAQFRHRAGKDVHAPGFYLHLEPGRVFVGTGLWRPPGATLAAVRAAIDAAPRRWREVVGDPGFAVRHRLSGATLRRAPRGYPADHPLIDDLKRTDFVSVVELSESEAVSPDFLVRVTQACREAGGFMRFLTEAVGLEY